LGKPSQLKSIKQTESVASSLVTLPQVSVTKQRKLPPTPEMERTPTVGVVALKTSNAGVPWLSASMPKVPACGVVPSRVLPEGLARHRG